MDLSGLESAEAIETKAVSAVPIRIIWDHLGCFLRRLFPVLFLSSKTRQLEFVGATIKRCYLRAQEPDLG